MTRVLANRFELVSRAASGGMGSVWRATDRASGALVAVKLLSLDRPFDLVRFERECLMLANLDHPNVVRYVTHGRDQGIHFLVQEWVDGVTLSTQLSTFGVTAAETVAFGIGLAEALGTAHDHGIVHRDVKPANVILDGGSVSHVKLVDFGIARLAIDAGVLTRTGVLIGTPSYMSPEQARGSVEITAAADVWALGCVLYEALTGTKAFAGRTPEAIRAKVLLTEPEAVEVRCPEAAGALAALVHRMLAKQPFERPVSGRHVAAALRAIAPLEGPRRRAGGAVPATEVVPSPRTPASGEGAANCFVYFTAPPAADGEPAPSLEPVKRISDRYELELHEIEDGSVILRAKQGGAAGAVAASRAALELKQEVFDGAVSVFGQAYDETIGDALERGAEVQARLAMEGLFAEALDGESHTIALDDAIADLICEEIEVDRTITGPVLKLRRHETG